MRETNQLRLTSVYSRESASVKILLMATLLGEMGDGHSLKVQETTRESLDDSKV